MTNSKYVIPAFIVTLLIVGSFFLGRHLERMEKPLLPKSDTTTVYIPGKPVVHTDTLKVRVPFFVEKEKKDYGDSSIIAYYKKDSLHTFRGTLTTYPSVDSVHFNYSMDFVQHDTTRADTVRKEIMVPYPVEVEKPRPFYDNIYTGIGIGAVAVLLILRAFK
jgi:hypothetical protein